MANFVLILVLTSNFGFKGQNWDSKVKIGQHFSSKVNILAIQGQNAVS